MNEDIVKTVLEKLFLIESDSKTIIKTFTHVMGRDILQKVGFYYDSQKVKIASSSSLSHEIFYFLCLTYVLGREIDKGIIKKKISLLDKSGLYTPFENRLLNQFPKLKNSRNNPYVPEVYSNFYAVMSSLIIGNPIDKEKLSKFISRCNHSSGLIYNDEYSNTKIEFRFESEYTMNILLSVILNEFLDLKIDFSKSSKWLLGNYQNFRSLAALFFSMRTLSLINKEYVSKIDKGYISDFLKARINDNGYFEYLLEEKFDEHMTSQSITTWDKNDPHVFSTFFGICIEDMLEIQILPRDGLKTFFTKSLRKDGGFGRDVLVKEFKSSLLLVSTLHETLLGVIFPSLL